MVSSRRMTPPGVARPPERAKEGYPTMIVVLGATRVRWMMLVEAGRCAGWQTELCGSIKSRGMILA